MPSHYVRNIKKKIGNKKLTVNYVRFDQIQVNKNIFVGIIGIHLPLFTLPYHQLLQSDKPREILVTLLETLLRETRHVEIIDITQTRITRVDIVYRFHFGQLPRGGLRTVLPLT